MEKVDILRRLVQIDMYLEIGDKDSAHYLILKLIKEMYEQSGVHKQKV